eukprot:CAMPEP_0114517006 /NCGR_PEP_ID=MMETSP0109-20121206/17652_1 /TAXON_ID=29199 /ORGANISM="Chlorarachnion reptans, Strain CCCM449" /LENGTH=790 /DNA_ID=CAMNT_0001697475 /DNA_START=27 /DNA_END=2399 /DNA_ORIENTATION=-
MREPAPARRSISEIMVPTEHKPQEQNEDAPDDEKLLCEGRYCTPRHFLIIICGYVFAQSFAVGGLFPAVISTLERRYNLSSTEAGMLSSCYDIGVLLLVLIVGYFGTHGHRPRMLSVGLAMIAIGSFIFAMPQLVGGRYSFIDTSDTDICGDESSPPVTCASKADYNYGLLCVGIILLAFGSAPLWTLGPAHLDHIVAPYILPKYLAYFYLFVGIGPAAGYVVASVTLNIWVDPGVNPGNVEPGDANWVGAWWIGWYVAAFLAVVFFVPMALFTRGKAAEKPMRMRPKKNMNMKRPSRPALKKETQEPLRKDNIPLGQVQRSEAASPIGSKRDGKLADSRRSVPMEEFGSPLSAALSSPVNGTAQISELKLHEDNEELHDEKKHQKPRVSVSRSKSRKSEKEQVEPESQSCGHFCRLLLPILSNKSYLLTTLGVTTEGFAVSGFSTFVPKAVESIFSLSSSQAALYVGFVIVPGAAGGIFFGGWLSNYLRLTPRQNAKLCWIVAAAAIPLLFAFFIGCDQYSLAGMSVNYNPDNNNNKLINGAVNFNAACNRGCGCANFPYKPVCGKGINYFSACYAGCTSLLDDDMFGNCTCVLADPTLNVAGMELMNQVVKDGKCDADCGTRLGIFLIILLFIMFATFMNNVPATVVSLKALPPVRRSLGISLQQVIVRTLGSIPGPLIFGVVIDSACFLWEEKCNERGSCWEYRSFELRRNLVMLALFPKLASFVFFFLAWWYFEDSPEADVRPGSVIKGYSSLKKDPISSKLKEQKLRERKNNANDDDHKDHTVDI